MAKFIKNTYWLLLTAFLLLIGIALSVGETTARYVNTALWNTVLQPTEDSPIVSDCLVSGEQIILLGKMSVAAEEGMTVEIRFASEGSASATLECVNVSEYLSADLSATEISWDGGNTAVELYIQPTDMAMMLEDAAEIDILVEMWSEADETLLSGTFRITLVPLPRVTTVVTTAATNAEPIPDVTETSSTSAATTASETTAATTVTTPVETTATASSEATETTPVETTATASSEATETTPVETTEATSAEIPEITPEETTEVTESVETTESTEASAESETITETTAEPTIVLMAIAEPDAIADAAAITAESETTTAAPETTTATLETTTAAPETTTAAPETTTATLETTTAVPEMTTATPEITTTAPETSEATTVTTPAETTATVPVETTATAAPETTPTTPEETSATTLSETTAPTSAETTVVTSAETTATAAPEPTPTTPAETTATVPAETSTTTPAATTETTSAATTSAVTVTTPAQTTEATSATTATTSATTSAVPAETTAATSATTTAATTAATVVTEPTFETPTTTAATTAPAVPEEDDGEVNVPESAKMHSEGELEVVTPDAFSIRSTLFIDITLPQYCYEVRMNFADGEMPALTRYSMDDGDTWYMLYYGGVVEFDAYGQESAMILLDMSLTGCESGEPLSMIVAAYGSGRENGRYTAEIQATPYGVISAFGGQTYSRRKSGALMVLGNAEDDVLTIYTKEGLADCEKQYTVELLTADDDSVIWYEEAETDAFDIYYDEDLGAVVVSLGDTLPQAGTYRMTIAYSYDGTYIDDSETVFFVNYMADARSGS